MRYRIISQLVNGINRFYIQKEKSFLGIKSWKTVDWAFDQKYAEQEINKLLNPEKPVNFLKIYESKK